MRHTRTDQIHRRHFPLPIFLHLRWRKDKKNFSKPLVFSYYSPSAIMSALLSSFSRLCPHHVFLSLSLSLMSHLAPVHPRPPAQPFILLLPFSHVLQHPGLPTTWLCGEPDWGSLKQRGALGLRQRLQADWERHSGVQEDHPQLLHLGCPRACLPGWGRLFLFYSFKSPAVAASSSLTLFLLPHIWPHGSTDSARVMLASHLNQTDWEPVPSQLERKQKSIPPVCQFRLR